MKTELLGPGSQHMSQVRILNRVLTWSQEGILYEADQRHAELIVDELGVTKAVATPGTREDAGRAGAPNRNAKSNVNRQAVEVSEVNGYEVYKLKDHITANEDAWNVEDAKNVPEKDQELLQGTEARQYRALAARANYLAQDRPDIQYAVKEIARRMSSPNRGDWGLLKRLARYLAGHPRAVFTYYWQDELGKLEVHTDSDWAGCKSSCRSTSGGSMQLGWHYIKSWSTTQSVLALSSAEAELYALVKGAAQSLGLISLAADLGIKVEVMIHSDASAALGIVAREGLGKLRHINVQYLWIQTRVSEGSLDVMKVPGLQNPADLFTKHLAAADVAKFCEELCLTRHVDRAKTAPTLAGHEGASLRTCVERQILDEFDVTNSAEQAKALTELKETGMYHAANGRVAVVHSSPRREFFMPSRHEGQPPKLAFTATRETHGRFLSNGDSFVHRDNWSRGDGRKGPNRPWYGWTCFILSSQ